MYNITEVTTSPAVSFVIVVSFFSAKLLTAHFWIMIEHCLPIEIDIADLKNAEDLEHMMTLRRPFIKSGYLDLSHSDLKSVNNKNIFRSILYTLRTLHNETFNIYTHLIPAILVIIKLFIHLLSYLNINENNNYNIKDLFLLIYSLSIIGCLLFSSSYHIGRCCLCSNEHDLHYWLKLDLFGIYLINTLTVPASAFILFECHQYPFIQLIEENEDDSYSIFYGIKYFNLQYFYTILFVGYSTIIIIPLWFMYPHRTGWKLKLLSMIIWIFSMCCASFHAMHLLNDEESRLFMYGPIWLAFWFIMAFLCLYYHIPECFIPGYFDIYGSSHQWFHIFIASAAIHWWHFLTFMSKYRDDNGCFDVE